jgi:hypothetical protein
VIRMSGCSRLASKLGALFLVAGVAGVHCLQASAEGDVLNFVRADNDGAQQAMQKQLRRVFEPMLKVELSFAKRVSKPTDEERRELIAAAVKWLDEFIVDFVKNQDQNEQQMLIQGMQRVVIGGPKNSADPRDLIQKGVARLVAEKLPAEKAAAYLVEVGKRDEFYRETIVSNLMVQLDDKILLASEQRESISKAMLTQWDDKWPPSLEAFQYASHYGLSMPRDAIRPELTPAQQEVFDQIQATTQQVIFGGMGMDGNEQVIGDVDLKERPDAVQPIVARPVADKAEKVAN